jgi:hypothetical protein
MASPPIRIELRHLATEREDAQRDLQETLVALEEKLLPQRAVRRLVSRHHAGLVLFGAAAVGAAIGFSRSPTRGGRAAALVAAAAVFCQLGRRT